MESELEKIRFQIAVQEEVIRVERAKAKALFDEAQQVKKQTGYASSDAREREHKQRMIVFDEEKRLRDLKEAEWECLHRKR